MSDTTGRAAPGGLTLALRAVFVPDGEEPPPDVADTLNPLRLRATLDQETGSLALEGTGGGLLNDLRAEWRPDPADGRDREETGTDGRDREADDGPGDPG